MPEPEPLQDHEVPPAPTDPGPTPARRHVLHLEVSAHDIASVVTALENLAEHLEGVGPSESLQLERLGPQVDLVVNLETDTARTAQDYYEEAAQWRDDLEAWTAYQAQQDHPNPEE